MLLNLDPEKKKRRGPIPKESIDLRTKRVNVYMTEDELAVVREKSKFVGVKVPELLRFAALGCVPEQRRVPQVNLDAARELAKLAGNINQIAMRLNTMSSYNSGELTETLHQILDAKNKLLGVNTPPVAVIDHGNHIHILDADGVHTIEVKAPEEVATGAEL
jgi:hypothetical protein